MKETIHSWNCQTANAPGHPGGYVKQIIMIIRTWSRGGSVIIIILSNYKNDLYTQSGQTLQCSLPTVSKLHFAKQMQDSYPHYIPFDSFR